MQKVLLVALTSSDATDISIKKPWKGNFQTLLADTFGFSSPVWHQGEHADVCSDSKSSSKSTINPKLLSLLGVKIDGDLHGTVLVLGPSAVALPPKTAKIITRYYDKYVKKNKKPNRKKRGFDYFSSSYISTQNKKRIMEGCAKLEFSDQVQEARETWLNLEESEKRPFLDKSDQDEIRYNADYHKWTLGNPRPPKKPRSAYHIFRQQAPNGGTGWSALTVEDRGGYVELAIKDKGRYVDELRAFKLQVSTM